MEGRRQGTHQTDGLGYVQVLERGCGDGASVVAALANLSALTDPRDQRRQFKALVAQQRFR